MLRESLEVMALAPGMVVVDATVGAGGHSSAFAAAIRPGGRLIAIDRDAEILVHAENALCQARTSASDFDYRLHHASYTEIDEVLAADGIETCDRVFIDLGVSSLQLDLPQRGFSLMTDGPLDMRMDQSAPTTAADLVRSLSEPELERILREYGEERHSRRVAAAIVEERRSRGIERTGQLADLVRRAIPAPARGRRRIHPATRTFQALRIAVNDELSLLERGLETCLGVLGEGGRLVVIAFHSLEDRIVKRFMASRCDRPFRKPLRPSAAESAANPRARSARLRCGIRRSA